MATIEEMRAQITARFGEGSIRTANNTVPFNHIPTGSFILDFGLMGGIPEGKATMIYGYESGGKTTLAKKIVAGYQRKNPDKLAVWLDCEYLFDGQWAHTQGVDVARLDVVEPPDGQGTVDAVEGMMEVPEVGLIVIDSIPAMVSKNIVDKSSEDLTMGELARLCGTLCSKIQAAWLKESVKGHKVTIIYTNQFRSKIGQMFGDPRTLPGGRQINHLPTTKLELTGKKMMGKDRFGVDVPNHDEVSVRFIKTKSAPSIREGMYRYNLNPDNENGLSIGDYDDHDVVVAYAKKFGLLGGGGAKQTIATIEDTTFKTMVAMQDHLRTHPADFLTLKQQILALQRESKGLPSLPPDNYLLGHIDV